MVSVGKDEYGRPVVKPLKPEAYFETYNDAYLALVEYNKSPYKLDESITMEELYYRWMENKQVLISPATKQDLDICWKNAAPLYQIPVRDLRVHHIKEWMKHTPMPNTVKLRTKNILNQMLDFAVEYELTDRNYAKLISMARESKEVVDNRKGHSAFTDDEMRILWSCKDEPFVDLILIQCYTGLRPLEMCLVRLDDVHLEENYFLGGMKTKAGTDRVIPIHPAIKERVAYYYQISSERGYEYLFFYGRFQKSTPGKNLTYGKYSFNFRKILEKMDLDKSHSPHDCRKQFVTMAKKYNVNDFAIKRIVGHAIADITEEIYTERSIDWLYEEVKKIKVDEYLAV
jgi:integrase